MSGMQRRLSGAWTACSWGAERCKPTLPCRVASDQMTSGDAVATVVVAMVAEVDMRGTMREIGVGRGTGRGTGAGATAEAGHGAAARAGAVHAADHEVPPGAEGIKVLGFPDDQVFNMFQR